MQSMVDFAQNTIYRCSLFVIISDPSFHYVDMIPGEWDLFLSAHDDKKIRSCPIKTANIRRVLVDHYNYWKILTFKKFKISYICTLCFENLLTY